MISVFTPTYNRAHTIKRVWSSLNSQIYRDFEWVIIDDGSEDNIEEVVGKYKLEAGFNITFHKFSKNKGKHIATNKALELAKGKFFVVADSDDAFTSDALQLFIDGWKSIPNENRDLFCGIRACCQNQNGDRVSDFLPFEPFDSTMSEVYYVHKFRKESWCMVLTDWHRNFLFPSNYKGYYPEGIIWKAMSQKKKLRFYNKATRIYYVEDNETSIMRGKKHPRSKISRNLVGSLDVLNNDFKYYTNNNLEFIKIFVLYICYAFFDNSVTQSFRKLEHFKAKILFIVTLPVGFCAFIYKSIFN